jgi:hypothetical protein
LQVFGFVLWSNRRGPYGPTLLTTEEINPFIGVEEFKKFTWRK